MWSPEALYEINQIAVNLSRSGKTERDALFMYLMKGESFRKSCGQNEEDSLYTTRINCFLPVSKNASLSDDEDFEALQESIAAMHAGEPAKSPEQFERDFRERHGLSPRT